jgi:hypothetical protein
VWEYDACLQRHIVDELMTDICGDEACGWYGCPACGWCPEYPESHLECAMYNPCPYIKHKYEVWNDEGELAWRKRDFLWVLPRLMAWKMRAVKRVEAEYAIDGPRGERCKAEFERDWGTV